MESEIWTEKYRPKEFDEIIGQNLIELEKHLNNLPNLFFISKSPGTGKTSLAKIIIRKFKPRAI